MFDAILETIKIVGAISGLSTAAFLIRDRYIKHFPVAIIVPRQLTPGSRTIEPYLFLKNVSDRPILVLWENKDKTQLRIAKDQTARGLIETMLEDETVVALGPTSDAFLPVIRPNNYGDIEPNNVLEIHLRWRFAQPRIWKTDRKIPVWIRKRDLDYMVDKLHAADGSLG